MKIVIKLLTISVDISVCLIWSVCLQSAHLLCNIVLPFEQFILLYSVSCYLHFLLLLTVCSKTMLFHDSEILSGPLYYQTLKETLPVTVFLMWVVLMFCDPYEFITDFWISYLFITRNLPYLNFEMYIENVYKKAIYFAITNLKYTHTYGTVFPIYL